MKARHLAHFLGGLLAVATLSNNANAQSAAADDYSVERFRLSTDRNGILDVEAASVPKHLSFNIGLYLNYADDPLNVVNTNNMRPTAADPLVGRIASPVARRLTGSLVGSLALWDRLSLGFEIPLILTQEADIPGANAGAFPELNGFNQDLESFGLSDIRVMPKLNLLNEEDHAIDLGIGVSFVIPTGNNDNYRSEGELMIQPELLVGKSISDRFRLGLNVGYRFRDDVVPSTTVNNINLSVTDELYAHVGAALNLTDRLAFNATTSVATRGGDFLGQENINHLEVKGGIALDLGPALLFAAAGKGITNGFGTPDWRALGGLRFGPRKHVEEEPVVEPVATPLDSDGDGLMDDVDQCPNEPETFNEIDDEDGCPDAVGDSDGDGIDDRSDQCPEQPEDVDTFQDDDGCPDVDNDQDGIVDTKDQCPLEPGVALNLGCPDKDTDGDTVPDRLDNCPNEPGDPSFSGCKEKQSVKITEGGIELLDKVYFRTNKAAIRKVSFTLLKNVAQVINNHPEITSIDVEGHTDSQGRDKANKRLSQRRADSVVKFLKKEGVDVSRLNPIGYGEENPIDTNDTKDGRAANRRVEFKINGGGEGIQQQNSGPTNDTK